MHGRDIAMQPSETLAFVVGWLDWLRDLPALVDHGAARVADPISGAAQALRTRRPHSLSATHGG